MLDQLSFSSSMNFLKVHNQFSHSIACQTILHKPSLLTSRSLSPKPNTHLASTSHSLSYPTFRFSTLTKASIFKNGEAGIQEDFDNASIEFDDIAADGVVYQKTLRLVECSMLASVTGIVYLLSNTLAIENYFGCFFALPIVMSSIRWGIAAGRKTMVATAMLLFVLSGPVKALTYLLTHGLVGFTMGSLWRSGTNWNLSIFLCTIVRSLGAIGYVLTSSFLIRENILELITINIHASLTYVFAATGINMVPSMNFIYTIFGTVLLLNSGIFMFLLHVLYSVFLTRLGMKPSLKLPAWLEKAI